MRRATIFGAAFLAAGILIGLSAAAADEEAGTPPAAGLAADRLGADRYAVVIAVDDYEDRRIPDLKRREAGAKALYAVLVDPNGGGVPEANAVLLVGAEATAKGVRSALKGLEGAPQEATVFVYFAGQGAKKDEEAFWLTQDASMRSFARTAVKASEVRAALDALAADRVVLAMDLVHTPGIAGSRKEKIDHVEILSRYRGSACAALGAAASKEHEIDAKGGKRSVFTHYLVEGLAGEADSGEDGAVALRELAEWLDGRVGAETWKRSGLDRPVVALEGAPDAVRFLLTIEEEELRDRLEDEAEAEAKRRERLEALARIGAEAGLEEAYGRRGRFLLGALHDGLMDDEREQRTLYADLADERLTPEVFKEALAAVRRPDRQVLVVPDDHETVQAAIDAASAGDTVLVKAGRYEERIVFKNGIRLKGEGRERTVLVAIPGKPEALLVEDCTWGVIEGLQLDGSGGTMMGDWSPDGIHVNRSTVRIFDCLGHSSLGCGIYAAGEGCYPRVRDCSFERNGHDGMCIRGTAGGEIIDSISRSNKTVGLQVAKCTGPVTIRGCTCEYNEQAGIGVSSGTIAVLEGNECQRNGAHGIIVWDAETSVTLVDNTCANNAICGAYIVQEAKAEATENVFIRNRESGIMISGAGTEAKLVGNRCIDNEGAARGYLGGIVFRDRATGEATSNTCDGNTCGILVSEHGTTARIVDNTCRRNKTSGIAFTDAAPSHAADNRCEENEYGITVSNSEATLQGNTVLRNTKDGILVQREGAGRILANRCESNEGAGIHVTGLGTRPELVKNTCSSNRGDGIVFTRGAGGRADGNECTNNEGYGINAVDDGTKPTLRRNRLSHNGLGDVGRQPGAEPVVEDD